VADTTFSVPKSPHASRSGVSIVADTRALSRLAMDLRAAAPLAWAACRVGLREAGEVVAADARERASFSTRIPASIKVRAARGNVKVVAGGDAAPDAAPIENRGKGSVRHPVFGNREVWTSKNSPPAFLSPAFDAHREQVLTMIETTLTDAVHAAIEGRF